MIFFRTINFYNTWGMCNMFVNMCFMISTKGLINIYILIFMSLQPSFVYNCKIEFQKKLGSQVSPKVFNPLWKINCTFGFFQVLVFLFVKIATLSTKITDSKGEKKWIKENWTWTQPMLSNYVSKFNIGHINKLYLPRSIQEYQ